jgi:hypothetical protein
MWATVLVFALMAATDPMRIGIAVMLISRPRPVANLFAFWLGGMVTGAAAALMALLVLREVAPMLTERLTATAGSAGMRHTQVAVGVLAVLAAAYIAWNTSVRQRVTVPVGDTPVVRSRPGTIGRLSARAGTALESGSPWVSFLVGLGSATPPIECLLVLTAIMASGAAIGAQITAAMTFTVLAFAIVEIPLISYLVNPAATSAFMMRVQVWVQGRRRPILAALLAMGGAFFVATGI